MGIRKLPPRSSASPSPAFHECWLSHLSEMAGTHFSREIDAVGIRDHT